MSTPVTMVVDRRRRALLFLALAALMLALDSATLNIALPSAQDELGFSDVGRQWVFTAGLAAVGLLLLGGRLADYFGRTRVFLAGLVGVVGASALAGAANGLVMLTAARTLYGLAAAALAPAALSLLVVMFREGHERGRAFAVYFGVVAAGATLGQLLGGVLVEYLGWRWCLMVNVPLGVLAVIGGWSTLPAGRSVERPRIDLAGVVLSTGGLLALAYGSAAALSEGWSAAQAVGPLVASVLLLASFWWWQRRAPYPLLPPRVLLDRVRAGSYLALLLTSASVLGLFVFLSYYFQGVLGYSPLLAGLAFLPVSVGALIGSIIAGRLLGRVAPRVVMTPALLAAAGGALLLRGLDPAGIGIADYLVRVLPTEILLGVGMGLLYVTAIATATTGVRSADAGAAAAVVNTAQDAAGPVGIALLNTVAAIATADYLAAASTTSATVPASTRPEALVHGFAVAAGWAAAALGAAALLTAFLVNVRPPSADHATTIPTPDQKAP